MVNHDPGVVKTVDHLSAHIPSGPPGYQYQEPNYRRPIGSEERKDKTPKRFSVTPQVNNEGNLAKFSQNWLVQSKVSFTRPPFEVQSRPPTLDYNLTPSSEPTYADIYDGLTSHGVFADEPKKRKTPRPMSIGLDVYPMGASGRSDDGESKSVKEDEAHKQKVLLHLNVFSDTPKFRTER